MRANKGGQTRGEDIRTGIDPRLITEYPFGIIMDDVVKHHVIACSQIIAYAAIDVDAGLADPIHCRSLNEMVEATTDGEAIGDNVTEYAIGDRDSMGIRDIDPILPRGLEGEALYRHASRASDRQQRRFEEGHDTIRIRGDGGWRPEIEDARGEVDVVLPCLIQLIDDVPIVIPLSLYDAIRRDCGKGYLLGSRVDALQGNSCVSPVRVEEAMQPHVCIGAP